MRDTTDVEVIEQAVGVASKLVSIKVARHGQRLRTVLQRLEEEATAAVSLHAMDLQSLGSRLLSQRDVVARCLVSEVVATEETLQEVSRTLKEAGQRHAEERVALEGDLHCLQADATAARAQLAEEASARQIEVAALSTQLSDLQASSTATQRELLLRLTLSVEQHAIDVSSLRHELRVEEATCVELQTSHAATLQRLESK